MPGIFGYKKSEKTDQFLPGMRKSIINNNRYCIDDAFSDNDIAASRVHLGKIGLKTTPYSQSGLFLWVEGEAYNTLEVALKNSISAITFPELLVSAYQENKLNSVLKEVDGYYCAALYDQKKRKIYLFSDRYGTRLLYYYHKDDNFAWASEVKGLLSLPFLDSTIDETSLPCFMDLGYLLGEHTWHKYIKLIQPASYIEYDLENSSFIQNYYWKWSEVGPLAISFDSASEQLGELMLAAVKKRFNPNEKIGIALSGGLDSRMLFAAVNHLFPEYQGYAFTFGIPGCLDVEIAKQVTAKTKWKHQLFYFTNENWFRPRIEKIFDTDGMMNMLHMHGSEFLSQINENIDINLNGFAGDAICGPSFLTNANINSRISQTLAAQFYGKYSELTGFSEDFYDIHKMLPNLMSNRVRRFTVMGSVNALTMVEQRKPFLDNDLFNFILSIPDEYRLNNRIYSRALLKMFPDFFIDIPWQKTGRPISHKLNVLEDFWHFGKRVLRKLGLYSFPNHSYTDYPNWLKEKDLASTLMAMLKRDTSLYQSFTDADFQHSLLTPHMEGKADNSEKILRAVTFEQYLKWCRVEM